MAKRRTWLVLAVTGLVVAACGAATGLPATGAGSSSPDAVEQAGSGHVGGGAPANANGNVDPTVPKQQP